MNWLGRIQVRWSTVGVTMLLAGAGWLAGSRLETVARPDPRPAIELALESPRTSARDLEVRVLFPLEQALGRLPYVREIASTARPGEVKLRIWLDGSASPTELEAVLKRWQEGQPDGMPEFQITGLDEEPEPAGRLLFLSAAVALVLTIVSLGSGGMILPIALALALSLIGTGVLAQVSGLTHHPLGMVALLAALGLVLDDLITVSENVVRHFELGSDPRRAARLALAEVRGGLVLGSLSVLLLWVVPALAGAQLLDWLRPLARVTGSAVLVSAALSLVVLPRLFPLPGHRLIPSQEAKQERSLGKLAVRLDRLADVYHDNLAWALDHRRLSGVLALGLLISGAVAAGRIGPVAVERAIVTIQGPDASTLAGVAARVRDELRTVPGVNRLQLSNSDGTISHRNGARVIGIEVELDSQDAAGAASVEHTLANLPVPPGYRLTRSTIGGVQSKLRLQWAGGLLLAAIGVWLIVARHFRSWIEPVSLLPAVLVPGMGVAAAAAIAGREFGLISMAALVLATGLALRQSILFLTFARRRRTRGAILRVAVIEAARLRLRPVLVSLGAVTGAMIPVLLLAGGAGPAFAWSVLGAVVLAGPATLLLVPICYEVLVEVEARYF
jgi:multidrug efflux pump subunit AcrB